MMRRRCPEGLAAAALAVLVLAGCAAPERRDYFEQQTPTGKENGEEFTIEVLPALRPVAEEVEPAFLLEGDGTVELSIEEAVMAALSANGDLRVSQLDPVIAGSFADAERGDFDPEFFVEADYFREEATETSRATGESFNVVGDDTELEAGIRQSLPGGTTFEASVESDRSTSNRAPDQQEFRVGLSVTQALLRGRRPEASLARVRQAELAAEASVYELRGFTEALVADVERAYWNHVLAGGEVEILLRSLEVARQQKEEVEEQIEVGLLPEIEAAAARAEVARREQALIFAEGQLQERLLELLRLLGQGPGRVPEVRLGTEPRTETAPLEGVADRLALADRSRPDLAEARLRLEQDRLETIMTRDGLLPKLDLFIALGGTGYAETFFDAVGNLGDGTYDLSAGIRLSAFLGNRAARAQDLAARATRQQAAEAVKNLERIVGYDVRLALVRLESARRQIAASEATRIYQEETLTAESERFSVGAGTALLVAQAQRDLLVSQIAEIRSVVNYRIARMELYRAEGSLLDRRGITISGAGGETPSSR